MSTTRSTALESLQAQIGRLTEQLEEQSLAHSQAMAQALENSSLSHAQAMEEALRAQAQQSGFSAQHDTQLPESRAQHDAHPSVLSAQADTRLLVLRSELGTQLPDPVHDELQETQLPSPDSPLESQIREWLRMNGYLNPRENSLPPLRSQTERLPSAVKVQVPKEFNGDRPRVPSFICSVERYSRLMGLDNSIMSLVPTLLTGDAEAWYRSLEVTGTAPEDWEVFKSQLIRRFGDPNLEDNKRGELSALKPGMSAEQLRSAMERIFVHLPDLPEKERLWHFKDKVRGTTRYVLAQHNIETLIEAYEMAEMVERAALLGQGPNSSAFGSGRPSRFVLDRPRSARWSGTRDQGPAPMELHAMQNSGPTRAPLTELERAVLIQNSGCFFCRVHNAGHVARDCPQRAPSPRPGNGRGRASC